MRSQHSDRYMLYKAIDFVFYLVSFSALVQKRQGKE